MNIAQRLRKNNKGSVLIMVIVCLSFIGIIGSMTLTAAVINRQMKQVNITSKDNFYTAEAVLEELLIGIEETANEEMKLAYTEMLTKYASIPDVERVNSFKKKFVNDFFKELTSSDTNPYVLSSSDIFDNYIHNFQKLDESDDSNKEGYKFDTSKTIIVLNNTGDDSNKYNVTIMNLSVSYLDKNGYETSITTDVVFNTDYPKLTYSTKSDRGIFYNEYAIIADGYLSKDKDSTNPTEIYGSIYAGDGIKAIGQKLNIYSENIITRKNIEAIDKACITIKGSKNAILANIWAQSIITKISNSNVASQNNPTTYFDIYANCYMANDLTLNAPYGNVIIKGNYYGYATTGFLETTNKMGKENESSAISVNASNSTLDMRGVEKLWVAGKSYIMVPVKAEAGMDDMYQILMGESISYKGNQAAYLIPGDCFVGIGHNPMTVAEYGKMNNNNLLDNNYEAYLDISLGYKYTGIKLEDYLKPNNPSQKLFVRFINDDGNMSESMVYLYMNFTNPDAASDYFNAYADINKERLDAQMDNMKLGSILFNPESTVNSGNALYYELSKDGNGNKIAISNILPRSKINGLQLSYGSKELIDNELLYRTDYSGLIYKLDAGSAKDVSAGDNSTPLTENLIDYDKLIAEAANKADKSAYKSEDNDSEFIMIIDGDYPITKTNCEKNYGLVVATGNVTVKDDCEFKGMIIAKGSIILGSNSKVTAASSQIESLIKYNADISKYFKDCPEVTDDSVNTYDLDRAVNIIFENWRKNK